MLCDNSAATRIWSVLAGASASNRLCNGVCLYDGITVRLHRMRCVALRQCRTNHVTLFSLGFSTVSPCFSLYISWYSVICFVYYILLVFYLYSSCNSVRMSRWNKRLITYLLNQMHEIQWECSHWTRCGAVRYVSSFLPQRTAWCCMTPQKFVHTYGCMRLKFKQQLSFRRVAN